MNWVNRIHRTTFYKWLTILLVVLLVNVVVDNVHIGILPTNWYVSALIKIFAAGLLIVAGKVILRFHRTLAIVCFLLGALLLLDSIYSVIVIIEFSLEFRSAILVAP